jgi:3-methyladenine DNA glycosylase/8-oxoguanine DNA glycosylase
MLQRTIPLPHPIDLAGTWYGVRRGRHSPTSRVASDGIWRATRSPGGPATIRFRPDGDVVEATAWGDGAEAALEVAPAMIGAEDHDEGFAPEHPLVARLWRDYGDHRIPRTGAVTETLISVVLEQRVTTFEARRAQAQLTRRYGEAAPGPTNLLLPPDPDLLANVAYYDLHVLGVEQKRADTVRRVAASAHRLDALVGLDLDEAFDRLMAVPGVGTWSAAQTATVALGDANAVPVGDAHLPSDVTYALTGRAVDDDEAMLDALEPFWGQRGRVIRLIGAAGIHAPRRGPRYAPRDDRFR